MGESYFRSNMSSHDFKGSVASSFSKLQQKWSQPLAQPARPQKKSYFRLGTAVGEMSSRGIASKLWYYSGGFFVLWKILPGAQKQVVKHEDCC